MLTRTLRAIAHHNGCSLMFTSTQHKEHLNKVVSHTRHQARAAPAAARPHAPSPPHSASTPAVDCAQFRTRVSHHLLGVDKRAAAQLNHLELVSVPVGADSFAQIGGADGDGGGDDGSVALVEGWRRLCAQYFPRKPTDAEVVVNLDELKLSAEPQLDQLVAQRE